MPHATTSDGVRVAYQVRGDGPPEPSLARDHFMPFQSQTSWKYSEALSQPPIYWPDISGLLPHLPNVNTVLHLPHLDLPHFGVGRSRLG